MKRNTTTTAIGFLLGLLGGFIAYTCTPIAESEAALQSVTFFSSVESARDAGAVMDHVWRESRSVPIFVETVNRSENGMLSEVLIVWERVPGSGK